MCILKRIHTWSAGYPLALIAVFIFCVVVLCFAFSAFNFPISVGERLWLRRFPHFGPNSSQDQPFCHFSIFFENFTNKLHMFKFLTVAFVFFFVTHRPPKMHEIELFLRFFASRFFEGPRCVSPSPLHPPRSCPNGVPHGTRSFCCSGRIDPSCDVREIATTFSLCLHDFPALDYYAQL